MKKIFAIMFLILFLFVSVSNASDFEFWFRGTKVYEGNCSTTPPPPPASTYTVTVSVVNSAGGSVSPTSVSGIAPGGQATLSVAINSGYAASVSIGSLSGSTWTITNVTSNLTATITFAQSIAACQSGDTDKPIARESAGPGTLHVCIPADTPALLIQVVGTTNETDAQFAWTFPDGRVFPTDPIFGKILGTGTYSVSLRVRSQSAPSPNISDLYIPQGRHTMTITGTINGWKEVGF
jgi:hypothetical protein